MVMIDLPSPGNGALDLAPSWCCKGSEDIGTCCFLLFSLLLSFFSRGYVGTWSLCVGQESAFSSGGS